MSYVRLFIDIKVLNFYVYTVLEWFDILVRL